MNSEKIMPPSRCDDFNSSSVTRNNIDYNDNENKKSNEIKSSVGDENNINMNDFFDFLNVSCQVNDIIKKSVEQMAPKKDKSSSKSLTVHFEDLAKIRLVNEVQRQCREIDRNEELRARSRRTSSVGAAVTDNHSNRNEDAKSNLHTNLDRTLGFVIYEGVMDPILPFICPVPVPKSFARKTGARNKPKERVGDVQGASEVTTETIDRGLNVRNSTKRSGTNRRKSLPAARSAREKMDDKIPETDVVIHVCDEVKNITRDFYCPQNLLVRKMGYFADIVDCQKLEDMDISVHCDIKIFEWLMRWMKYSARVEQGSFASSVVITSEPLLDSSNVVPILVSANFLQMEPLIVECLAFCHAHLSNVVRSSANVSSINDAILSRLAAMFTNVELEMVRDRKERVTPRLWTKLIQSLFESGPEVLRGHYFTLAGLFRCSKCGKCLTRTTESYVACVKSNVRLNRWGQLVSFHVRDNTWNISEFITELLKDLNSWRMVYWVLWGYGHYLYCKACEQHFPAYQITLCPYHPDIAVFLGPTAEGRNSSPIGRYPCCAKQAYRYDTLKALNGCRLREHIVQAETDRERGILSIAQLISDSYAVCLPPKLKGETSACKDVEMPWCGILMTPRRTRKGLLPVMKEEDFRGKVIKHFWHNGVKSYKELSSTGGIEVQHLRRKKEDNTVLCVDSSASDEGEPNKNFYTKDGKRKNEFFGRYWNTELSVRKNQDNQRDYEERIMKKIIPIFIKKLALNNLKEQKPSSKGGSYVRLEAEWKDQLKKRNQNLINQLENSITSGDNKPNNRVVSGDNKPNNISTNNNSRNNANIGNIKQINK